MSYASLRISLRLYTRTIYESTLCKEIAKEALEALHVTVAIVQNMQNANSDATSSKEDQAGRMVDGPNELKPISDSLNNLMLKARYLKNDANDLD